MKRIPLFFGVFGIFAASHALAGGFISDVVKGATGGSVDLDKHEICVGPACINDKGKTRTKSPDEVINDAIGQVVPGYATLPEADKAKILGAAKDTGVILASTTMDPFTGGIVIQILTSDKKEEVVVPTYKPNPPPTQIQYNLTASCLVQRDATSITAAFADDSPDLQKVNQGDVVNLTAPICPTFGQSITSVAMTATSKATEVAPPSKFKWILLGNIKS